MALIAMQTTERKQERHNLRGCIHLFNLIKRRSGNTPNFALLIGAGASISSKVKPTNEMMKEWEEQIYAQSKSNEEFKDWESKQDWFNSDEKYSMLFEKVYDQPAQRRNYIEECVKDAKPSWGYIYLANMIAYNYFNVIFTPNFDDLTNEACFTYANCKPIVCAHDSAVSSIRITSHRPKIVKLHGDFLYDNIKNTIRETENLEKNMRDKFVQFAKEYGLIVIGYSGSDRSIMDILNLLTKTDGYFPHGVYWCVRKGSIPNRKLEIFLRKENVFVVEIADFDEFMADMHHSIGLILPDTVRDPFKATTDNLNRFIKDIADIRHPLIKADLSYMQECVKKYELIFGNNLPTEQLPLPYEFMAQSEFTAGNFEKAAAYYEKALIKAPGNLQLLDKLAESYTFGGQIDKALEVTNKMKTLFPKSFLGFKDAAFAYIQKNDEKAIDECKNALQLKLSDEDREDMKLNLANVNMILGKTNEALVILEEILAENPTAPLAKMNKAIALKRLGRSQESKALVEEALPLINSGYLKACAYGIINNKEEMLKSLASALKGNRGWAIAWAKIDPDFEDYRNDQDFLKLLNG